MKILRVLGSNPLDIGGVNNSALKVSSLLSRRGHEFEILSFSDSDSRSTQIAEGITLTQIRSRESRYLWGLSNSSTLHLARRLRDGDFDAVHLHGFNSLVSHQSALVLHLMGASYLVSPHYSPFAHLAPLADPLTTIGRTFGRPLFRWAGAIVCISEFEADLVRSHFSLRNTCIEVIPNGVDYIDLTRKSRQEKTESRPISLLYVGHIIPIKGIHHVLEVVHELAIIRGLDVELDIVGTGSYRDKLVELALDLGVSERVRWHGVLHGEELARMYLNADVLLLLSESENFGTVVAESLALGTPAIVTTNSALREFTSEVGCFGVHTPVNPSEVAEIVTRIHSQDVAVKPSSGKIITWDQTATLYERAYERVAGLGHTTSRGTDMHNSDAIG